MFRATRDLELYREAMEEKYISAYKKDDCAVIDEMLKTKEIDPNHNIGNWALLQRAIFEVRPNIVKLLIDNGASVTDDWYYLHDILSKIKDCRLCQCSGRCDHSEQLPKLLSILDILMEAIEKISMETLIRRVFHVDTFLIACQGGDPDILGRFLNLINDQTRHFFTKKERFMNNFYENPFHFIRDMDPQTVSILINRLPFKNSLINEQRMEGQSTPLHLLAKESRPCQKSTPRGENLARITKLLIDESADPDILDSCRATPLHWAILSWNDAVVEVLLRAGCRLNVMNEDGFTPLATALNRHRHSEPDNLPVATRILELLLAFGVDLQKELCLYTPEENPSRWFGYTMYNIFGPNTFHPQWLERFRQLRQANTMNSLQRTCRKVIRRHLKPQADDVIKNLTCIPDALKSYLMVENEPSILS